MERFQHNIESTLTYIREIQIDLLVPTILRVRVFVHVVSYCAEELDVSGCFHVL